MRTADCIAALAFLGFSAAYYLAAEALPFSPSFGDPGPAELPFLIALIMGITAIALGIRSVITAGNNVKQQENSFTLRGAAFLVWSVLATVALPWLHTPVTLAVYVFGGILIQVGRSGLRLAVLCAPLVSGLVYALFSMLLDVPLP